MATWDEKTASPGKGKKMWDKESRLFAGLVTGLAGIVGAGILYFGTILVGAKEERSRSFDLLSNREVAAHALQVEIFDIFAQHVVPALEEGVDDHRRVALLAGLHSNFSEFFDTRPVFEAFAEKVLDHTARHELTRLAKRVARQQAEFIKAHVDTSKERPMYATETVSPGEPLKFDLAVHEVTVSIKGKPYRHYLIESAKTAKAETPSLGDDDDDRIDDVSDYVTVEMTLNWKEHGMTMGPLTFELSYMDTPYMDNIWMRHSDGSHHQMALRLVDIDTKNGEHAVKIEFLHFPGDIYAATQRLPVKELLKGGHAH